MTAKSTIERVSRIDITFSRSAIEELRSLEEAGFRWRARSIAGTSTYIESDCAYRDVTDEVVLLRARERVIRELFIG